MVNTDLLQFVRESRRRGFGFDRIKEALLSNGWPLSEINPVFEIVESEIHTKHNISVSLDDGVLRLLEKRAKKNMMTLPEQIEDILRRSVINSKGTTAKEKLDDMLVGLFSRKKRK